MITRIFFLLIFFPIVVLSQQRVNVADVDTSLALAYYNDKLFTGILVSSYRNGVVKQETNYIKGKVYGTCKWFHKNGNKMAVANKRDGKYHGVFKRWYKNGQMEQRINFRNGERHGLSEFWHRNGQITFQATFRDGKFVEGKAWKKNGKEMQVVTSE